MTRRAGATNSAHGDAAARPDAVPRAEPGRLLRTAALALVLVVAVFAAYRPALQSGYIWDDESYVHQNVLVQGGWPELLKIWIPGWTPQYYPLVFTSFWVEDKLWGVDHPPGFHIVNVLLHALNALLVWRVAARLGIPAPAFIAAVFALHPVHVESVAWITERKNVMSGLFYLLAMDAYLRFDVTGRWRSYAACAALFICALLSKTVTASLPAALLLILFFRRGLTWRDAARIGPLLLVGAAAGLMTAHLERAHVGAEGAEWSYGLATRAAVIAPSAFVFYGWKLLWPHPLIFIYPRWEPHAPDVSAYVPLMLVLVIFGAAWALRRRIGWAPLLLLCFSAGTLFPALGFLNVFPHRYSFVADHFNYLGSLGFIVLYVGAAVRMIDWLRPRSGAALAPIRVALGAAVLIACGILTYRQCFDYKDIVTLWERTLAKNPHAWIAQVNLGELYRLQGGRAAEARALFERAAEHPIARVGALGNLGLLAADAGDFTGAVRYLREAAAAQPEGHPERWFTLSRLGWALQRAGQLDEAIAVLTQSADLAPNQPDPDYLLAQALLQSGRVADARARLARVVQSDPTHLDAFRVAAGAALQAGDCAAALDLIERGRRVAPDDPPLIYHLIWVRCGCPDGRFRDGAESITLTQSLMTRYGQSADTLDALGAAYAETGDFARAVYYAGEALTAARQTGADAALLTEIEARLKLFRAGSAFRFPVPP